jgi:hypothetical protein
MGRELLDELQFFEAAPEGYPAWLWPDENGVDGAMWGRFVLKNCYAPAY